MIFPICHFSSAGSDRSLRLWLDFSDASTLTLSGSNITQANDKSGYGNHAIASSGHYPTIATSAQNGRNAAVFTNAQSMSLTSLIDLSATGNHTVIAVMKSNESATVNDSLLFGYSGSIAPFQFVRRYSNSSTYAAGNQGYTSFGNVVTNDAFHCICFGGTNSPYAGTFFLRDNVSYGHVSDFYDMSVIPKFDRINLRGTSLFGAMMLGEVKVWSRLLTTAEKTGEYTALKTKWGTP